MNIKDWNSKIAGTKAYQKWEKDFLKSETGKVVVSFLRDIKDPPNPPDWLESQVLSTCYQAIKYTLDADIREVWRLKDAEGLKDIHEQILAIKKLIKFNSVDRKIIIWNVKNSNVFTLVISQ